MIVGLGHVARAGKDTAATALSRDLGFKRVAFADPIKQLALELDNLVQTNVQTTNVGAGRGRLAWVVQSLGGWEAAKDTYPEVRRTLQNLGNGARKLFGEDFWVNQALESHYGIDVDIVVSDVRYLSEVAAIQNRGGKVIRIDRPGHVAQGHVSETELRDFTGWDAVIKNDGTVQDLEAAVVLQVKAWMEEDRREVA